MRNFIDSYYKTKVLSSYFSVIIITSLVLFLLGCLGVFLVNTKEATKNFKENMEFFVFLKNDSKKVDQEILEKSLSMANYVKKINFVSKEDAAKEYSEKIGEDFIFSIGENPLQNYFNVSVKSSYVQVDSLKKISENILKNLSVSEVVYDKTAIDSVNSNISKIVLAVVFSSLVLLVIAMLVIDSSIKLSIHSKIFIINAMQFVGATKSFIVKPFIRKNIFLGLIASIISCFALFMLMKYLDELYPFIDIFSNTTGIVVVFIVIFSLGIVICGISTYFATKRFLSLNTDDLYSIQ